MKHGKIVDGKLVLAKNTEEIEGRLVTNPTAAMLGKAGFKPVFEGPEPRAAGGWHYERDDERPWRDIGRFIVARWNLVRDPGPELGDYDAAMEDHLRREREQRGYTTREPDSYLGSDVPRWAQDAKDWVAHRDAVMLYALALMNDVKAGKRRPPSMDDFKAGLPKIEWTYPEGE